MITKFTYTNEAEFRAAERYFVRAGFGWGSKKHSYNDYPTHHGTYTIGVDYGTIWYNFEDPTDAVPAASLLPNEMFKALKNAL